MITANIKIIGADKVKGRLARIRTGLSNRKDANHKAVIVVDAWIQKNFEREGELTGKRWPSLAESTELRRRKGKKKKGHKILQDTGDLKGNWKHFWNNRFGMIRSKTPYAVYHDSDKPRKKLPRRQILPDSEHVSEKLRIVYGKFVKTEIRRP